MRLAIRAAALVALISGSTFTVGASGVNAPAPRIAIDSSPADRPPLAVSLLNPAASANEIVLISPRGDRLRIDPHPPMLIDGAWSPDGKRIAFTGHGENHARGLYLMNAQGTDVRLLFVPPTPSSDDFLPYWSPDGRELAFVGYGGGPWIIAVDGGKARRLGGIPIDSFSAPIAWSPDGRTLAFGSTANGALYTIGTDGKHLRRLTPRLPGADAGAEVGSAAWSPDGRRIAFVQYPLSDSPPRIKVVNANGGHARRVARGDYLAWSPDGHRLAFLAPAGIGIVSPRRPHPRVISNPYGAEGPPAWTTNGSRIVFASWPSRHFLVADVERGGARRPSRSEGMHLRLVPPSSQIWTADGRFLAVEGDFVQRSANLVGSERERHGNAHGNAVVRILTAAGPAATFRWSTDDTPTWSPDGRRIAFVRSARTKMIYVVNAHGGRPRALIQGHNPAWSPEGESIAFERRGVVFVVSSAGGRARRIGRGHNPAWSPSGHALAFDNNGVFITSAEGGRPRRLVAPYRDVCFDPEWFIPERPAWSHDGRLIAYDEGLDADCPVLGVVGRGGGSRRHLARGEMPQFAPGDSRILYLVGVNRRLAAVDVRGHGNRIVSDQDFIMSFSISSGGRWIAYDRLPCTRTACTNEIWIARTDGSGRWPLLRGSIDVDPAWRPR